MSVRRPGSLGTGCALAVLVALLVVPGAAAAAPPRAGLPHAPSTVFALSTVVDRAGSMRPAAPAVGGASARMIVGTHDPGAVPNDGLATNLTAFPSVSLPKNSSFQTGAEEVIGASDAVFGLFTNDVLAPVAFFEVFNNSTDASLLLEYWTGLPIVGGDPYDFQLVSLGGGTWQLSVNGVPFGDNVSTANFAFGASSATWEGGIGFSEVAIYSAATTVPSTYVATTALAVHRPGSGWYLPTDGEAHYEGPPGDAWGADGRDEIPDLAPGSVESGTSLGAVETNSSLWSGGPVAVEVSVSVAQPSVSGLAAVGVTVTVTTTSGASLGGVPVYVGDALGGSASPSTVLTSADGSTTTLLLAPNVSASATDTVRATVTILGYTGSSSVGLGVVPAVEVVVTASPGALLLSPNENVSLTFETRTSAGLPVADVTLVVRALSFAAVIGVPLEVVAYPQAGTTNATGAFTITVLAPDGAGSFSVLADVASLGAWGHANVSVSVRTLGPTFWQRYGSDVLVGGGVAVVLGVAAVLLGMLRRRRRGRTALPEMDLRSLRQQGPTDSPSPVTRTPPASGTP